MKRWVLVAGGWVMLAVAALTLLYRLADFLLFPPAYDASAFVEFTASGLKQQLERELEREVICHRFVFSTNVLYPVCDSLGLVEKWTKKYGYPVANGAEVFASPFEELTQKYGLPKSGTSLTKKQACVFLLHQMQLTWSKNEGEPVKISFFSDSPEEAVEIANAVAASLKGQLDRLEGMADGGRNVRIQNAIKAQRISRWPVFLVKTSIIVVPCIVMGVILIWMGRLLPPLVPIPPQPAEPIIIQKY